MTLEGGEESFQKGERDDFSIILHSSILPLSIVTLSHDNSGPYPEWHVDRVAVESKSTGEVYFFDCGQYVFSL